MKSLVAVLVAAILAFVRDCRCLEANVVIHPEPLNATLGSTVAFHCTVVGDAANWKINGKSSYDPENIETLEVDVDTMRRNNTYISTLTLHANTEKETTIQCVAVSYFGASVFSQEVIMLVQGFLDAPSNVSAESFSTENTKHLTWTPPFTLDITDLDPDITYRVCNNDTNTCVDTADTSYIFLTSNTKFSVKFLVSACNPVGCSDNSTITVTVTLNKSPHSTAIGTPPSPTTLLVVSLSPSSEVPEILNSKLDEEGNSFGVIGGAVGALLVVTAMGIVFVIFIAVYIRCKKEKGSQTATVTVEIVDETTDDNVNETTDANTLQTRRNSAYVTHQLHAQKIKLEKCPAYESVVERCRDAT